jgi:hypothetical protein
MTPSDRGVLCKNLLDAGWEFGATRPSLILSGPKGGYVISHSGW